MFAYIMYDSLLMYDSLYRQPQSIQNEKSLFPNTDE